ncbi:hypothetical protein [Mycobacteroides chelonae]|uniref:hypothetical protein n=1 Tax=Mycobacteroides chelonae TaxID=1774 RepID=UPI0020B78333|nr:hypothetical protein [Mycobacteroides chelonae]
MRGRAGGLICWRCSLACAPWPAGVPEVGPLEDLAELALGDAGAPDGPLPAMRFESVGFTACGLIVELGAFGVLGDSALDGVLALGISGSFCGSGAGALGVPV